MALAAYGQSYNDSTSVNYDSRVINYDCRGFKRWPLDLVTLAIDFFK